MDNKIWITRRARIQTEKRLLSNAFHSQLLLLWYSFSGVAVAIYYLSTSPDQPQNVIWVVFSVLVLVMSGYIQGFSYKKRADAVKLCYENLDKLYIKAKNPQTSRESLYDEYKMILDSCENHTTGDFYEAICVEYLSSSDSDREKLTKLPNFYIWTCFTLNRAFKGIRLLFLYTLPGTIFYCMLKFIH
jgi:hypothetical protein